jgi:hypothetical protein
VNDWALVWLGVMAVSLAIMAALQCVVAFTVIKAARETAQSLRDVQRDLKPLIDKAHRIADDAARTTAIAAAQAQRLGDLVSATTDRVDETLGLVYGAIAGPLRHGSVVIAVARAVMAIWHGRSERRRHNRDDDDALFVG